MCYVGACLAHSMSSQYPMRPAHMPYPIADLAGARVRMQKTRNGVRYIHPAVRRKTTVKAEARCMQRRETEKDLTLSHCTRGENEQNMQTLRFPPPPPPPSGRFDKHTLTSEPAVTNLNRYVAGVFKDGERQNATCILQPIDCAQQESFIWRLCML